MRIRRNASRLLGTAYSASAAPPVAAAPSFDLLPTPPHPAPCSALESCGGPGFSSPSASSPEACELSRSPWDLIAELSFSDQKAEDELMDKYFVNVTTRRSSWHFSATMPATSSSTKKKNLLPAAIPVAESSKQPRREVAKKAAKMNKEKEGETKKKAKVKKEEGHDGGAARLWMCKKNDGRRWHCNRPVSKPNTLCDYHSVQKRSYLNPDFESHSVVELEEAAPAPALAAASKPSTGNKQPWKKKKKPGNDCSATDGFYYYTGFGPFRSKRQCRSSGGMNEPLTAKQEDKEETPEDVSHPTDEVAQVTESTIQAAAQDDVSSGDKDIAAIAGIDEESSNDEYDGIGVPGCNKDGTVDPQASIGDLGKRKAPWKRWRKPVKARSLKSLM